jgi:hypothetical protein
MAAGRGAVRARKVDVQHLLRQPAQPLVGVADQVADGFLLCGGIRGSQALDPALQLGVGDRRHGDAPPQAIREQTCRPPFYSSLSPGSKRKKILARGPKSAAATLSYFEATVIDAKNPLPGGPVMRFRLIPAAVLAACCSLGLIGCLPEGVAPVPPPPSVLSGSGTYSSPSLDDRSLTPTIDLTPISPPSIDLAPPSLP